VSEDGNRAVKKATLLLVKWLLVLWGILSALQGAGLSFFMNGETSAEDTYLALTYSALMFLAGLSFLSSAIASVLSLLAFSAALWIVSATNGFGHPSGIKGSLIRAVVLRPGLGFVIFTFAAIWERRWFSVHVSKLRTVFRRQIPG
jgi:hypothetical protein